MCYYITTEAPELLLDANMSRDHLAMLGTDITLSAVIKGMPPPTVSWKKNDGEAPAHATIAVTASGSKMFIPKSVRPDSGNYTITVENAAGSKTATCVVLVLGWSNFFVKDSIKVENMNRYVIHFSKQMIIFH